MRYVLLCLGMLMLAACERIDVAGIFESYLWEKHVLVVMAPRADSQPLKAQWRMIQANQPMLEERDVVVWVLVNDLSVSVDGEAKPHLFTRPFYTHFAADPEAFTVLLLGIDGEEKLRQHKPLDADDLAALIDAMPLRKKEAVGRDRR